MKNNDIDLGASQALCYKSARKIGEWHLSIILNTVPQANIQIRLDGYIIDCFPCKSHCEICAYFRVHLS